MDLILIPRKTYYECKICDISFAAIRLAGGGQRLGPISSQTLSGFLSRQKVEDGCSAT